MLDAINNAGSAAKAFGRGMAVTANNIANALTPGYKPQETIYEDSPDGRVTAHVEIRDDTQGVDLAKESVDLISAKVAIKANIQVMQSSERTIGLLLDTFG